MKIYVQKDSLYLIGSFQEILEKINQLAQTYSTVQEAINSYLH